jgi:hypothetical protein
VSLPGLTREERVVMAVRAGHTYAEVARRFPGLTRSAVAGVVWRADPVRKSLYRPGHHPASADALARAPSYTSKLDGPLLELLSDGRERTTDEIVRHLHSSKCRVYRRLRHLMEAGGVTREFLTLGGGRCAVWREAAEA